jgi:hypothetical protein
MTPGGYHYRVHTYTEKKTPTNSTYKTNVILVYLV